MKIVRITGYVPVRTGRIEYQPHDHEALRRVRITYEWVAKSLDRNRIGLRYRQGLGSYESHEQRGLALGGHRLASIALVRSSKRSKPPAEALPIKNGVLAYLLAVCDPRRRLFLPRSRRARHR